MLGDPPVSKGTTSAHKVENSLSNLTRCGPQKHPGAGNEAEVEHWLRVQDVRGSSPAPRERGRGDKTILSLSCSDRHAH